MLCCSKSQFKNLISKFCQNKLAQLRRCVSRVHFEKIHFGEIHFGNRNLETVTAFRKKLTSPVVWTLCEAPQTLTQWKSESVFCVSVNSCIRALNDYIAGYWRNFVNKSWFPQVCLHWAFSVSMGKVLRHNFHNLKLNS